MKWQTLREKLMRTAGLWQRRRQEDDLADELEFHLAMKQRRLQESEGLAEEDARHQARRSFGGVQKWKETCRDVARWRTGEELARDLALAFRLLRKSPVFTIVALATLTLAIGANTAIFSLMDTLMLKRLRVPEPERLTLLRTQPDAFFGYAFSYPVFKQIEKNSAPIMQPFGFANRLFQIRGSAGMEQVPGQLVSGHYFAALGVRPRLGRAIEPSDDRPGTPGGVMAVVSERFFRTRLQSDRHPLGRSITVNGTVCTVIGVMPDEFRGINANSRPDVFLPLESEPSVDAPFNSIAAGFGNWWMQVAARRNPGVSQSQVDAYLKAVSHRFFEAAAPSAATRFNDRKPSELSIIAEAGSRGYSFLRIHFQKPLVVLMALVGMVLLIASLNLASLLLARSAARNREIATRFALGASRGRLLRQLLTESLLLSLLGTSLGLVLSPALARLIGAILAPQRDAGDVPLEIGLDGSVLMFIALLAILVTLMIGGLPAFRSTQDGLHRSQRGSARRQLWPRFLLSAEVALALVLVSGASLLGYSLLRLHQEPTGFRAEGLVYVPLDMHKLPQTGPTLIPKYQRMVEQIQGLPGVQAVSVSAIIPLDNNLMTGGMSAPGGTEHEIYQNRAGPDYFKTMGTALLAGREFRWDDVDASGKKVILNESAARVLFPKGGALGRRLKTNIEVVGIVADAKYSALRDLAPPTAYLPASQDVEDGTSFTLLVRTSGDATPLVAAVQHIVQRLEPDIPLPVALSMDQLIRQSLASERIMALLAMFFGGLALIMTAIGLYGTLAYATAQRTAEIGIRLALGARRANVISLICSENAAIAFSGLVVGLAASLWAVRFVAGFLYGVSTHDPLVFGWAAVALLSVAAAASMIPALKASRIDPITAIRYE